MIPSPSNAIKGMVQVMPKSIHILTARTTSSDLVDFFVWEANGEVNLSNCISLCYDFYAAHVTSKFLKADRYTKSVTAASFKSTIALFLLRKICLKTHLTIFNGGGCPKTSDSNT